MRVYRIDYMSPHSTNCVVWAMNKAEAKRIVSDIRKHPEDYNDADLNYEPTISLVEVPTDKAGLVYWLNAHFNTDNG